MSERFLRFLADGLAAQCREDSHADAVNRERCEYVICIPMFEGLSVCAYTYKTLFPTYP